MLVSVGAGLGAAWENAMPYFDQYTHLAVIVIVVLVLLYAAYAVIKKQKDGE